MAGYARAVARALDSFLTCGKNAHSLHRRRKVSRPLLVGRVRSYMKGYDAGRNSSSNWQYCHRCSRSRRPKWNARRFPRNQASYDLAA